MGKQAYYGASAGWKRLQYQENIVIRKFENERHPVMIAPP
jgi:hypothetical protein